MPRYGKLNESYIASWFERDDPGGPMWALNLMKYRKRAEYADGRESSISGMEADDEYAPHEHLRKVGSRIVMMAPVVVARGSMHSDTDYVVIVDPALDDIARSLTDTSKVLF